MHLEKARKTNADNALKMSFFIQKTHSGCLNTSVYEIISHNGNVLTQNKRIVQDNSI